MQSGKLKPCWPLLACNGTALPSLFFIKLNDNDDNIQTKLKCSKCLCKPEINGLKQWLRPSVWTLSSVAPLWYIWIGHLKKIQRTPPSLTLLYTEFSMVNVKINVNKPVAVNCVSLFNYANLTVVGIIEVMSETKRRESSMRSNFAWSDCKAGKLLTEKFVLKACQFLCSHSIAQTRSIHSSRATCCPRRYSKWGNVF